MGYVTAIVPSIGVLVVFWLVIRSVVQADRRERAAQTRIESAERMASRSDRNDVTD